MLTVKRFIASVRSSTCQLAEGREPSGFVARDGLYVPVSGLAGASPSLFCEAGSRKYSRREWRNIGQRFWCVAEALSA